MASTVPVQPATAGMAGYRVTPAEIQTAAQQCNTTAQEVQGQLGALKAYVMNLETEWLGVASQTFNALMTDWDIYASMLNQALIGISNGLNGNWANYTDSESRNIANLQQVNGALPGNPGARLGG
jgi:WXG100 family type VII secretion target